MSGLSNQPLRIAMLSVHSCPLGRLGTRDTGGMSVYTMELARELGKRGHMVDVYTRAHSPAHGQVMELGQNARLVHLRAGEDEMHKLAMYVHLPDFACALEEFRRRNSLHYDVIYSHYWLSAWVGRLVQTWWNIPHMAMFHTLGAVKNAIGIGEEEAELRVETERYLIRNCHRVIAATDREKADIIACYGAAAESVRVVPGGVNLELFRPIDKATARRQLGLNGEKTLLFVGRIEPVKGVDRLLAAVARLKSRYDARLLVVGGDGDGDGDYDASLRSLCRWLDIQDNVSFLGLVEQNKLPCYYSAADCCVVPSYYESFGLVALESLGCGTPVVATCVGIAASVIQGEETGHLLADNTPRSIAKKVSMVLARGSPSAATVNATRAAVSPFSWANTADQIAKECRSLVSSPAFKASGA